MTLDFSPHKNKVIAIVCAILVLYVVFQARNLILGPRIAFIAPLDGETLSGPVIEVRGTATNVSFITLNDKQIFVNDNGEFKERLLPSPGLVILTLKAKDRFGREKIEQAQIVVLETKDKPLATTTEPN